MLTALSSRTRTTLLAYGSAKFLGEFLGRGAILEPEAYDARLTLAAHAEPPLRDHA